MQSVETTHLNEADLEEALRAIIHKVERGGEIIIERDSRAVAVIRAVRAPRRTISECIALLPEDSTATIDPDFQKDVEAVIASHPEPLDRGLWD